MPLGLSEEWIGPSGRALAGRAAWRAEASRKAIFDECRGDVALPELTDEAQVEAAEVARGVGQTKIEPPSQLGGKTSQKRSTLQTGRGVSRFSRKTTFLFPKIEVSSRGAVLFLLSFR